MADLEHWRQSGLGISRVQIHTRMTTCTTHQVVVNLVTKVLLTIARRREMPEHLARIYPFPIAGAMIQHLAIEFRPNLALFCFKSGRFEQKLTKSYSRYISEVPLGGHQD